MEPGKNVDLVVDLTEGTAGLQKDYFALGICCSVLEHVRKPWVFAEHLSTVVRAGGALYMSVPWVWRYHAYPDDYFRFSWRGGLELFSEVSWAKNCYSTNVPNEFVAIVPNNTRVDKTMAALPQTPPGEPQC